MRGVISLNSLINKAKKGDTEALEALWEQTKGFAFTVARRYTPTSYADSEDLQQCAYLGFHTAVMQHTGKYRFLSLVQWCTQRECQKLLDLYGSRRQLRADSLDIVLPDGEHTPADLIEDESLPEHDAALIDADLVRDVRGAVAELPERERYIIERRWFDGLTVYAVGEEINVSGNRVCQIERRAFDRLRADPILRTYAANPASSSRYYKGSAARFRHGGSSTESLSLFNIQREECAANQKRRMSRIEEMLSLLGDG